MEDIEQNRQVVIRRFVAACQRDERYAIAYPTDLAQVMSDRLEKLVDA